MPKFLNSFNELCIRALAYFSYEQRSLEKRNKTKLNKI